MVQASYLGVILQGGLKIDDHVTETANKAKRVFHALARLGGQGWGYQAVNYIVLLSRFCLWMDIVMGSTLYVKLETFFST